MAPKKDQSVKQEQQQPAKAEETNPSPSQESKDSKDPTEKPDSKSSTRKPEKESSKKNPFFFTKTSNAIAIRIKELDECCCANVPCISIVKEYCESSSLHGLRYITEDGRHWTERVLWVLLCLCGFILTVYFIYPIWSKWNEKPTITTLDSTDHPVWKIDFPGVTICPGNKVVEYKLKKEFHTSQWQQDYGLEESDLKDLTELLVTLKTLSGEEDLQPYGHLRAALEGAGLENLTSLMAKVMPDCTSHLLRCWWQGRAVDCQSIFDVRKTNDGFCCSFNALKQSENVDFSVLSDILENDFDGLFDTISGHDALGGLKEFMPENVSVAMVRQFMDRAKHRNNASDSLERDAWNATVLDEDYEALRSATPELYPYFNGTIIRRLNSASYHRGLTMLLDAKSSDYYVPSDDLVGFKLLLHDPRAYPEVEGNTIAIAPGMTYEISALHVVSIFKDYSQENCLLECRARLLLERCACLPYYYPRMDLILREREQFAHLKNRTCDWQGWKCLANSTELLDAIHPNSEPRITYDLPRRLRERISPEEAARTRNVRYFAQRARKPRQNLVLSEINFDPFSTSDLSLVHVYFKDLKLFKYHTDELFSWENILASFGGLIGLCTGFSFLSLAELAYFFTLRCTLPICRQRRREKVAMISTSGAHQPGEVQNGAAAALEELVMVKVEE